MPGDSNKQTQSSSTEPWAPAQPILQQGLTDAQALYKNGQSFQPYKGSTVVPYSNQTQQAMKTMGQGADWAQDRFNINLDNTANYGMYGMKNGLNDIQQGVVGRLTNQATNKFNPNDNPGFQSVLKQATDSAGQAVDMGASAAGRYGSGIHQGNVAREVGNVAGQLTSNEYNDFKNRQDAANTSLFNAGQQGTQNVWGQTDALSNAYQARQAPSRDLMNIGAMNEDLAGRTLNDQLRIWQGQQDAPKNALQWLSAIGSGAGSLGGTSNTSAQGPKANPFGQAIGGLLGANSLFGGL